MGEHPNSRLWVVEETEDINEFYLMGEKIGQPGTYGYARIVQCKETGEEFACKVIQKSRLGLAVTENGNVAIHERQDSGYNGMPTPHGSIRSPSEAYSSERVARRKAALKYLRNEISILKSLDHPHIIKFVDLYEDRSRLFLVTELCRGGELFDRIAERVRYSEKGAFEIARQLFIAVSYMHSKNVAHLDLKPENLMLANKNADAPLKIIDFGMAQIEKSRKEGKYFSNSSGTPSYVSPEVLARRYDRSSDMWSLGCILYTMLIGFPPFFGNSTEEICHKISRGFIPEVRPGYGSWFPKDRPISELARKLISRLLVSDMSKRITAEEALMDPWLSNKGENLSDKPLMDAVVTSLLSLGRMNHFKAVVLQHLVGNIEVNELTELRKTFSAIDQDQNGFISVEELKQVMSCGSQHRHGDRNEPGAEHATKSSKRKREDDRMETGNARVEEIKDDGNSSKTGIETGKDGLEAHSRSRDCEHDFKKLVENIDVDGDGLISYQELLMATEHRKLLAKEERMWVAFHGMDRDGNGMLEPDELASVVASIHHREREDWNQALEYAKQLISMVDKDGDGKISYEEFVDLWLTREGNW